MYKQLPACFPAKLNHIRICVESIEIFIISFVTVPREWQGEMDRRVRAELWALRGGVVGARVGEATGHLVNGVGLSTVNHAQDLNPSPPI